MATLKETDSKKWINALVAICALILGFSAISFFRQLGEWFELESKIPSYDMIIQFAGIVIGLTGFLLITRTPKYFNYFFLFCVFCIRFKN